MFLFSPSRLALSLLLVLAPVSAAVADVDLTGRWFTPQSTTRFAEIVQTGTDVTLSWTSSSGPVTYMGTFDQTKIVAYSGGTQIQLGSRASGDILYGHTLLVYSTMLLTRCECDDGNIDDGDGCDSECRVEECFTCTGEPSVCVPSLDAASCDDRSECTTGETCTSGSCGAGTPVASCIDVGGLWRVNSGVYTYYGEQQPASSNNLRFMQQDGAILVYHEDADPREMPLAVGDIETTSGTMSYGATDSSSVFCSPGSSFSGEASGDAASFTGTVSYSHDAGPIGSCSAQQVDATGTRCHATLGCDLSDCTGLPDGTPCEDPDVCTNRDACSAGTCVGQFKCPLCQDCTLQGDCYVSSRSDCGIASARRSNQLSVNFWSVPEQLRWYWKKGPATAVESFGDPATTNEMALCIYNGDDDLIHRDDISPNEACEEPPCWTQKGDRISFKGSELALSLRAGADGRAGISFRSRAFSFYGPLSPVVKVQLHIDTGACFGSYFSSSSVTKDENGKFKATSPE